MLYLDTQQSFYLNWSTIQRTPYQWTMKWRVGLVSSSFNLFLSPSMHSPYKQTHTHTCMTRQQHEIQSFFQSIHPPPPHHFFYNIYIMLSRESSVCIEVVMKNHSNIKIQFLKVPCEGVKRPKIEF